MYTHDKTPKKFIDDTPKNSLKKYGEIQPKNSAKNGASFEKNFLKKQVGYNNKKSGTKRVLINKSDNIDVATGDDVYLITPNQFEVLNAVSVEDKTKIKQLQIELDNVIDNSNKKIKDNVEEITKKHNVKIKEIEEQHQEDLKQQELQHQEELDKKIDQHQKEIKELKDQHQQESADQLTVISKLQQELKDQTKQHNTNIKDYQQSYQESLNKIESLIKDNQDLREQHQEELDKLKDKEFNYVTLYNNLINDIKNIGWFDAIRNKHKGLLKEYHQIRLPLNNAALEIKQDSKHNQD